MTLIPQLNNQDNWELLFGESYQRDSSATLAKIPIPVVRVPIEPDEHLLAILVGSNTAPERYFVGGYASFWVQIQIDEVGGQRARVDDSVRLQLNEINLVRSPKLSDTYELRLATPRYFDDVTYGVYEYIGLGEPTIEGKLDSIHDQVIG